MTEGPPGPGPPPATVTVTAPVRIADVGGWSDTWFAGSGAVCHLGVDPGIEVRATLDEGPAPADPVRIVAPDLGEDFLTGPSAGGDWSRPRPGRQPLLEHAVASVYARRPPTGPVTVSIHSAVPPGASLGTSASVVVAVVAALETLLERDVGPSGRTGPGFDDADRSRLARHAHRVETEAVGRESGVQDQWAAAFGGAQLVEIPTYPTTRRVGIDLDDAFGRALEECTVTVVLGPHDSSAVHQQVITHLTDGADQHAAAALAALAALAHDAADALRAADPARWAAVLTEATETQRRLHPGLIGPDHQRVIDHAVAHEARGWKVNGAGGNGGSTTVVLPDPATAAAFAATVTDGQPAWSIHRPRIRPGVEGVAG